MNLDFLKWLVWPHKVTGPSILLDALPDPNLEMNDFFFVQYSLLSLFVFIISKSTKQDARADIDDAEEAIPLLWGKLFFVFMYTSWFFKNRKYLLMFMPHLQIQIILRWLFFWWTLCFWVKPETTNSEKWWSKQDEK